VGGKGESMWVGKVRVCGWGMRECVGGDGKVFAGKEVRWSSFGE